MVRNYWHKAGDRKPRIKELKAAIRLTKQILGS
jgi:hypothetical protein